MDFRTCGGLRDISDRFWSLSQKGKWPSAAPLHCLEGIKFETDWVCHPPPGDFDHECSLFTEKPTGSGRGGPHMQKQKHPPDTTGCLPHPRPLRSHGSTVLRAEWMPLPGWCIQTGQVSGDALPKSKDWTPFFRLNWDPQTYQLAQMLHHWRCPSCHRNPGCGSH